MSADIGIDTSPTFLDVADISTTSPSAVGGRFALTVDRPLDVRGVGRNTSKANTSATSCESRRSKATRGIHSHHLPGKPHVVLAYLDLW